VRISMVTHSFPPDVGSMATWNKQIAESLVSVGHKVTVFAFQDKKVKSIKIDGVRVRNLCIGKRRTRTGLNKYFHFFLRSTRISLLFLTILPHLTRSDLWQGCFGEELYLKVYMCIWRFILRKPLCLAVGSHIFEHTHTGWKASVRHGAMELVLRSTTVIISNGSDLKLNILQEGIVNVPIHVLYPAIDPSVFWPGASCGAFNSELKERGLSHPCKPRLFFMGRMMAANDPEQFLAIARRFGRCGIIMVGTGELKKQIQGQIEPLGERALLASFVPNHLLPSAISCADICVFPFTRTRGGIPFPVLQAMACGKPVVAYDVGDLKSLIRSGENGVLVPCGNRKQMEREIHRLLEYTAARERMGEVAATTIIKKWNINQSRLEYGEFYRQLMEDWKTRKRFWGRRKSVAEDVAIESDSDDIPNNPQL
jgi:glycosyltransferase involved in cell wall biosynthesis